MNTRTKVHNPNETSNFLKAVDEKSLTKVLFCLDNKGEIQYEKWADIPEFEGYYECSTFGRVKSLRRTVKRGRHYMEVSEKIMAQNKSTTNYYAVQLSRGEANVTRQTHQIMAMTFLSHTPSGYEIVVDHKDNNPEHNFIWNIQLITHRLNASKDKKYGTSQYVGVSWNEKRQKWVSAIYLNGSHKHLGFFESEKIASQYYQNALKAFNLGEEIEIKKRTETSEYKGVYKGKTGWKSRIQIGKDRIHLGTFETELEAHNAYVEAEINVNKGKDVELHRKETTSQYKGVSFNKSRNKWQVMINEKYVGRYESEIEAHKAYLQAEQNIKQGKPIRVSENNHTSQLKGAYLRNGKWISDITRNKVTTYIGAFKTEQEAHQAYCDAEKAIKNGEPIKTYKKKMKPKNK